MDPLSRARRLKAGGPTNQAFNQWLVRRGRKGEQNVLPFDALRNADQYRRLDPHPPGRRKPMRWDEGMPGDWLSPKAPYQEQPPKGWGANTREPPFVPRKKKPPGSWRGRPPLDPYAGPEEPHSKGQYPREV